MFTRIIAAGLIFIIWSSASASPATSLNRKPGLWSLDVSADGRKASGGIKQCVDEATDARMMQMASQSTAQNCSKNELVKEGSGYSFYSECSISGSSVVSRGTFTGDFNSRYVGEINTTFTPALFGKTTSKTVITAQWQGPCPEGMKAGDMAMPNGMKLSLDQAEQSAKMASQMMNNPELAKMMKGAIAQSPALQEGLKKLGEIPQ
jgi:hypothetical protein